MILLFHKLKWVFTTATDTSGDLIVAATEKGWRVLV